MSAEDLRAVVVRRAEARPWAARVREDAPVRRRRDLLPGDVFWWPDGYHPEGYCREPQALQVVDGHSEAPAGEDGGCYAFGAAYPDVAVELLVEG